MSKDTSFSFTLFRSCDEKITGSGMQLSWVDSRGILWQTTKGIGDQANSFYRYRQYSLRLLSPTGYADYTESTLITASFNATCMMIAGMLFA